MNKFKVFFFSFVFLLSSQHIFAFSRDKRCLIENIGYNPTNLNPHRINDFSKMRVFDDLFEGLVVCDQKGEIIPGCADNWEISEDGKTYTFHIRKKAKWSNGDHLTAHDFVFSFRSAINPKNPVKYFTYLFDNIVNAKDIRQSNKSVEDLGVKAIDDYILEIRLNSPDPMFLNLLCLGIFFPVHRASIEKFGLSYCSTPKKTVCNGAYTVREFVPNGHIELKRNSKYWDFSRVKIKKVKFLSLQDAFSDMQAFNSGTIDITYKTLPIRGEKFYKEKYGDSCHEYQVLNQDLLIFNLENPKFKEVNVKKALAMAIHKELYIDKIIKFGELSSNPVLEIFSDDFKKIYEQLPEYDWTKNKFDKRAIEAEWLFEEFFTEEKPLKVTITYPVGTFYKNIAEFIQNCWRKVFKKAIQIEIEAKLEKDLLQNLYKGNFEICLHTLRGFYPSPTNFASFYVSDNINNFSRYKNPNFDKIFYDSLLKKDDDLLLAQLELSKILLKDFVSIPLFSLPVMKLINKNVGGFNGEKNILDRYRTKDLFFIEK